MKISPEVLGVLAGAVLFTTAALAAGFPTLAGVIIVIFGVAMFYLGWRDARNDQ